MRWWSPRCEIADSLPDKDLVNNVVQRRHQHRDNAGNGKADKQLAFFSYPSWLQHQPVMKLFYAHAVLSPLILLIIENIIIVTKSGRKCKSVCLEALELALHEPETVTQTKPGRTFRSPAGRM